MRSKEVFDSVDSFFNLTYYFAKLNLFFWFYLLKGFIVFGIFPSFVTLLTIVDTYDVKEVSTRIKVEYKKNYKNNFKSSNIIGWVLTFIGVLLYFNYTILVSNIGSYSFLVVFSFFTLIALFTAVVIWIVPLLSLRKLTIKEYFKYSLISGIVNLHYTVLLSVMIFMLIYVSLIFPALLLFFTHAIIAFLLVRITKNNIFSV